MVTATAFKTRARTIDHLGREQIADCPTAISELWKNAFDAYARRVELHIFDGEIPTASLVDNGHGMSRYDFEDKWLTIGTESKTIDSTPTVDERDGLPIRHKQGQKGIGRLSCAALGSLLLILTKRKECSFTAALIDWRLFENPFLMLADIHIPVVEFDTNNELLKQLPDMFDTLMGNIWGDGKDLQRDNRLVAAWNNFDALENKDIEEHLPTTRSQIEKTVINTCFDERQFSTWEAWTGKSPKGTALFMSGIHDDLRAQISTYSIEDGDAPTKRAQERLHQTLSNFIDPFSSQEHISDVQFQTAIYGWNGFICRPIMDTTREFDINNLENLEHTVDGSIDEQGVFFGRLKVFGKLHENITIRPSKSYQTTRISRFGPFDIKIGSYEGNYSSSSHTKEEHSAYEQYAEKYSGLLIYRDDLRVMPYGREDNDYFEIEKRRSHHAGRYFWSNRRLFGRVAITRADNPNLRDKAGREGLIDNKASKLFRDIVEGILKTTASRYFGNDSENRKSIIEEIQANKVEEKALLDKRKWLARERQRVKSAIKLREASLAVLLAEVKDLASNVENKPILTKEQAQELKRNISDKNASLKTFSLSPIPPNLGSIQDDYREYRRAEIQAQALLNDLHTTANKAIELFFPKSSLDVLQTELQRNAAHLHASIRKLANEGRELLSSELGTFNELVDAQNKAYHLRAASILDDFSSGAIELNEALTALDYSYQIQEFENNQILKPYISALKTLKEQIDIEGLAAQSVKENFELRKEADRLHSLAQLGITVEIIGHEIEGLDLTITRGLKQLPQNAQDTTAYKNVVFAHQGLSDRWRFLSPLKLSGERTKTIINGEMIFSYISSFFRDNLEDSGIQLKATDEFKRFSIYEQPARIYPVFINLVNNSRYWVKANDANEREILLSVKSGTVVISDTGPGVEEDDFDQLFTLFFTRKARGGRGVGLYLCRTNLQAGGHKIRYETVAEERVLNGANFVIEFKDANYE